jgi:tRNA modification GTPase
MESFIHEPYQPGETIAAVATPPGEGGVAIIRISGKDAVGVADRVFTGSVATYQSHTAHFGRIRDNQGRHIDDALVLPMLGKRSFTGEDTVEIHCHGGSLITRRVLDVVLKAGARPARPGEFSFKAFMNGKLDLAQAEAIQELVAAKNEHALNAAEQQLQGALSAKIRSFQIRLTDIAAMLEAWVDFPEEDIEFADIEEVINHLSSVKEDIETLSSTFHDGRIALDGVALCLVGSPNVGKSSLMNAMLERDRAIVSHIPGTTRDILEDNLRLGNLNFRLTDTAGIRETDDVIEKEGVLRSRKAMKSADLVLLVLDLQKGISEHDRKLFELVPPKKTLVVWNKSDLTHKPPPQLLFPHVASVSAKTREGFDYLKKQIDDIVWTNGPPSSEEVLITNARHKEAIDNAAGHCQNLIDGLKEKRSPEFLSLDMRQTLTELGKIIGMDITEDILSAIFSKFCIGK